MLYLNLDLKHEKVSTRVNREREELTSIRSSIYRGMSKSVIFREDKTKQAEDQYGKCRVSGKEEKEMMLKR